MAAPKAIIINNTKRCPKCDTWKELEAFGVTHRGYQSYCKDCRKKSKKGKPTSPAQQKSHRAYILRTTYGITMEDYDSMLEAQGGVCKICCDIPTGRFKYLCVDHCHSTGKVRGLLCHNCNKALGMIKDDISRLRRMLSYLEEHK